MGQTSGLFNAGRILLLVGSIVNAVAALIILGAAVVITVLQLGDTTGGQEPPFVTFAVFYYGLALVMAGGTLFGFLAYEKARDGDAHGAWVRGLVASLLPPIQVVLLVGAVLCLTSPEGQANQAAASEPRHP